MKAIVFDRYGSLDNLGLRDIAKPAISQDEVLVRVHAAGVHVGDCFGVKGKPFAVRLFSGQMCIRDSLNDLSLTPDGSVYVTDSQAGRIYRLAKGAKNLVAILPAESLEGPNGIIAIDGGDLLVADFHGLSRIRNPSSPKPIVARLEAPGGLYLGGIDGLARRGEQIIGIQNLVGRSRVWSLQIAPKEARVTQAMVLLRGHHDFLNPTTGAIVDRQFLFVADTKLEQVLPDGTLSTLPPGRKGRCV